MCIGGGGYKGCVLRRGGRGSAGGTILNSTITGNTAVSGGGAHGAELRGCVLSLNSASSGGGAVKSCTVKNSALTANFSHASGGAADARFRAHPLISVLGR